MGINSEALKKACRQYETTLISNMSDPRDLADSRIALLYEGLGRVAAGRSLSAEQKDLLLKAIATKIGFVERDPNNYPGRDDLLAALERSREGLDQWPVLHPLSTSADIPVPEPLRHVIDIEA